MSDLERKPYRVTHLAGLRVAGRRVPQIEGAGKRLVPDTTHVLHLTKDEAKYELLSGTIVPADEATAPVAADAPTAPTSTDAGTLPRRTKAG